MSPDATGAGADCCEAMRQRKFRDYGAFLDELDFQGIRYILLTFSSAGRLHPDAASTLETIAPTAARKRGLGCHRLLLRRALGRIGIQLWRRAASMIRSCLPAASAEDVTLLFGDGAAHDDDSAESDGSEFDDDDAAEPCN